MLIAKLICLLIILEYVQGFVTLKEFSCTEILVHYW